jgi:ATP-dependent RNA helicase RhlE
MLDLGFIHALKRIVKMLPPVRQSLFFSATMPKNIAGLAAQYLRDPVQVAVTPVATTAERVEQQVIFVHTGAKQALLNHILRDPDYERVLVFTRTKHGADRVVRGLDKVGIGSAAIHGNKSQPQRERALAAFKDGTCRVLVATDIAARGIDVEAVSHVVNYDLPNVPESYVHRIGRTARAGKAGLAVSFCNDEEKAYLRDIERTTRQSIPVGGFPEGFSAPSRQEAVETAADEARRPPRQQQGRPGQRQGRPGGGAPGGGRNGRPQRQEPGRQGRPDAGGQQQARGPRPDGRQGERQDQRGGRPGERQDQRPGRPGGHQGQRTDSRNDRRGDSRPGQGRNPRPAGGGGGEGRNIGWLERSPGS